MKSMADMPAAKRPPGAQRRCAVVVGDSISDGRDAPSYDKTLTGRFDVKEGRENVCCK
jgi:hypothetical protein